jgi:hypothetical protein
MQAKPDGRDELLPLLGADPAKLMKHRPQEEKDGAEEAQR